MASSDRDTFSNEYEESSVHDSTEESSSCSQKPKKRVKCSKKQPDTSTPTTDASQESDISENNSYSDELSEESSDNDYDWKHFVRKNLTKLEGLRKANKQSRSSVLRRADKELIECLCECVQNTLKGKLELTDAQYHRLDEHKHTLRKIAKHCGDWRVKKAVILQDDGFMLPLLTAVFSNIMKSDN